MLEWIKDIAMFLVFSGLLLEMTAETKYYKFLRWGVGMMLLLQVIRPITDAQGLWEKMLAKIQSFEYAVGSEKILEQLYETSELEKKTVEDKYKQAITAQVEKILDRYETELVYTEIELNEDGSLSSLFVKGEYRTEKKEGGSISIPTIRPIETVQTETDRKENDTVKKNSPMELYLRETLAEFYQLDENRIEVVIQEAER